MLKQIELITKFGTSISRKKHAAMLARTEGMNLANTNFLFKIKQRAHHDKNFLKSRIRSTPKHIYIWSIICLLIISTLIYIQFAYAM